MNHPLQETVDFAFLKDEDSKIKKAVKAPHDGLKLKDGIDRSVDNPIFFFTISACLLFCSVQMKKTEGNVCQNRF